MNILKILWTCNRVIGNTSNSGAFFFCLFFFFKSDTRSFGLCSSGSATTRRWCELSSSPCTLAISPETLSWCFEYHWYGLEWISRKFYVSECHVLSTLSLICIFFRFSSHSFQEGLDLKMGLLLFFFFFPAVFPPGHVMQVWVILKGCWIVIKDLVLEGKLELDSWSCFGFCGFFLQTILLDNFSPVACFRVFFCLLFLCNILRGINSTLLLVRINLSHSTDNSMHIVWNLFYEIYHNRESPLLPI